jgi:siroheme synthase (precorrin-2 oxidase/ferrochelatase)
MSTATSKLPRLGFIGLGWIGQNRMQALLEANACEVAVVADPSPEVQQRVRELAPSAAVVRSLDELLQHDIDGAVIATPSALHASQAMRLLERRIAVFCQKPLARTATSQAFASSKACMRFWPIQPRPIKPRRGSLDVAVLIRSPVP